MTRRLVVEADGGSRGNPGPAGFGAVVRDAGSGEVLAELSESLGTTTNNVAEYSGLVAGLRAVARLAPGADVEVRMDSKLVVEQMSGRWQIKHPDLRPLAASARQAAGALGRVRYEWVPRSRNTHADRLANMAMDAAREARTAPPAGSGGDTRLAGGDQRGRRRSRGNEPADGPGRGDDGRRAVRPADGEAPPGVGGDKSRPGGAAGWGQPEGPPVTTVLLRHGETPMSPERRFSGRRDVALTDTGLRQAEAAARRLAARGGVGAIVASPLRRARQTAEAVAAATGAPVRVDEAWAEIEFGEWEGLTFAEAAERWPEEVAAWVADTAIAPPGGESFAAATRRVLPALDRLLESPSPGAVLVVSHVTPVKILLRHALLAPPPALRRMHLDVASLCEIDWYPGGVGVVRSLNDTAHLRPIPDPPAAAEAYAGERGGRVGRAAAPGHQTR